MATDPVISGRRAPRRAGFTLAETAVVLVLTAVLAGAALPALRSTLSTRQKIASRQVARDLSFARARAVRTGRTVWVVFAPASDTYSLLEEPPTSPGRAGAVALTDPATGRAFSQRLNTGDLAGVNLVSVSLGGGTELGFDWRGRPKVSDTTLLTSAGTITLTGGSVNIEPETGLASWQ